MATELSDKVERIIERYDIHLQWVLHENNQIKKTALTMFIVSSLVFTATVTGFLPLAVAGVLFGSINFVVDIISGKFGSAQFSEKISETIESVDSSEKLAHMMHHLSEHHHQHSAFALSHGVAIVLAPIVVIISSVVGTLSLGMMVYLLKKTYDDNVRIEEEIKDIKKSIIESREDTEISLMKKKNILLLTQQKLSQKRAFSAIGIASSLFVVVLSTFSVISVLGAAASIVSLMASPVTLPVVVTLLTLAFILRSFIEHKLNITSALLAQKQLELDLDALYRKEHALDDKFQHQKGQVPNNICSKSQEAIPASNSNQVELDTKDHLSAKRKVNCHNDNDSDEDETDTEIDKDEKGSNKSPGR